ncbi:MAG: anthranilate synthase component II, partial [Flavobacteriales bacterium]
MKTLILDNYDSFTFNLVHYLEQFCDDITVKRNDEISLDEVDAFDAIVLSPGPGLPKDAGIMPELIKRYSATKKILGVCLGQQAIGEAFGAKLKNLN